MSGSTTAPPAAPANPLRIQRVTLTDFRAFPGPAPVTFDLEGKNLLVYGENGAGKSSLFHALRDFFALDSPGSMAQRLASQKNLFSEVNAGSCAVEVSIKGHEDDELPEVSHVFRWSGGEHPATRTRLLSREGQPIAGLHSSANLIARDAARRSAFLDYKSLLDTNYKHGAEEVNLFDLAVSALLADFRVTVPGGTESTISELWQAIKQAEADALLGTRSTKKEQKVRDACVAFNVALRSALDRLLPRANDMLQALGWSNVELTGLKSPGVTYQTAHRRSDRKLDGLRLRPDIRFRGKPLDRPQLFLNEARLSGLALALYFGARLACVPASESQTLKLLVLDDVLVGLDQANRIPVLDVLKLYFHDWQIVLLTHDRAFYEIGRQRLDSGKWARQEIYAGRVGDFEKPLLVNDELDLYRALDFLDRGEIKAAAVHVRSAFEQTLKDACFKLGVHVKYHSDPRKTPASDLWSALKSFTCKLSLPKTIYAKNDPSKAIKCIRQQQEVAVVPPELVQRIDHSVSWILNPLSHSQAVDRYRREIEDAIYAVDELGHVATRVSDSVKTNRLQLLQSLAEVLKLRSLQMRP